MSRSARTSPSNQEPLLVLGGCSLPRNSPALFIVASNRRLCTSLTFLPSPRRLCNHRCLFVCLSVCLLAALRKKFRMDLHDIFNEGWQWAIEQTIKFWWRSGSRIRLRIRIRIATLVRRALAEICTVSVLLVVLILLSDHSRMCSFCGHLIGLHSSCIN